MPLALLLLVCAPAQQLALDGAPALERVAVVATAAPGAEIISLQASTRRAVLTHAQVGLVELFDLGDPAAPRSLRVIDLALAKGEEVTSVALPPSGDWFLATVRAKKPLAPGRAQAHALSDGKLLASFPCGVHPDGVTIAASGASALIANEGEGFERVGGRLISAPGSVTWIRFAPELARSEVLQIPFELATSVPTDGRRITREVDDQLVEIELGNGAEFLEPEIAVFLPGELRALVSLQENNAVAYVDLGARKLERILGLGHTSHPADLVADGQFEERGTLLGRREPDGIALTPDGRHFVTADEGDTEPGLEETPAGKPVAGGRTLSVFALDSGDFLGDTGPQLDRMAAKAGLYPDKRSPRKGSEPEMVLTFERGGTPFAALTLERAGALALVDLRDPRQPTVVAIAKTGADHLKDEPEGLAFFRDPQGGPDYLYVANEGTSTLGVLRIPR